MSNVQKQVTYFHHGERTVASLSRQVLDCEGGLVEIGAETPCMIADLRTYPRALTENEQVLRFDNILIKTLLNTLYKFFARV